MSQEGRRLVEVEAGSRLEFSSSPILTLMYIDNHNYWKYPQELSHL